MLPQGRAGSDAGEPPIVPRCPTRTPRSLPPVYLCGGRDRAVEDPLYVGERANRYYTFERVLAALGSPQSPRLLDVGAYCGYFVDVARQGGFRAEGTELSLWATGQAQALGLTVHNDTVTERAASGDTYDVVTMWTTSVCTATSSRSTTC